jgi:hypothetical protein
MADTRFGNASGPRHRGLFYRARRKRRSRTSANLRCFLRPGAFAEVARFGTLAIRLRGPRSGQIARVLDGVLLKTKTRKRSWRPSLADVPSRVIAPLYHKNALLHPRSAPPFDGGAFLLIGGISFSRRGRRCPSRRRTSRRTSPWRPCSWRRSCRRARPPSLPPPCASPWRPRSP